ncbi:MAG: serine hydrolase domain-containing protein [Steroidobacter sp.]
MSLLNRTALALNVKLYVIAVVIFLVHAPILRADDIDEYLTAQMRWEHIPGLSIVVVQNGRILRAGGYGFSNLETGTHARADTVYKMGSLSKQFLAAGLLVLVQDGKVGLDDPVNKYLPDVPEAWKPITVRNLLTHTSGIARDSPAFDPLKLQSDDEVVRAVYSQPLQFKPGSHFAYSNINYYCVAEIIQKASGMPWQDFIASRIFAPVGLSSTRTTTVADIVPHRASGYETSGGRVRNADIWIALRPSGAFLSTVLDLARWANALDSGKILTAAMRDQMWTPMRLTDGTTHGYGFGWFLDEINGHRRVHHSGGVPGFVCEMEMFPDDRLTVIIMANIGSRDLEDMAVHVAGHYKADLHPPEMPALPDIGAVRSSSVRLLLEDLAVGRLPTGSITLQLRNELAEQKNAGVFDVLQSFGPLLSTDLIQQQVRDGRTVYTFRVKYSHITLYAECSVGDDNKLSQFGIHD